MREERPSCGELKKPIAGLVSTEAQEPLVREELKSATFHSQITLQIKEAGGSL